MFFDTPREAEPFDASYIEIARLQKQLLSLRYDAAQRIPRPLPVRRKGLFGRETVWPDGYEPTAQRLQAAQQRSGRSGRRPAMRTTCAGGPCPGSRRPRPFCRCSRCRRRRTNPTRPAGGTAFRSGRSRDRTAGSCSALACARTSRNILRPATRRMSSTRPTPVPSARRLSALTTSAATRRPPRTCTLATTPASIRSRPAGATTRPPRITLRPNTMAERMRSEVQYSESLYTVEEQRVLHVSSNSQDRVSVHAVCEYRIDAGGTLDWLAPLDFAELQATSGDATPAAALQRRDARRAGGAVAGRRTVPAARAAVSVRRRV